MFKISTRTVAIVLALVSLEAWASAAGVFPGKHWQQATPESQGLDSAKLAAAMKYLDEHAAGRGASETVVIRNGSMVWKGPDIDAFHTVNSCTKTFTTTVLGLLVQDGKCTLDQPVVEHLPSLDDRFPAYSRITFRHLASFTSGYDGQRGEITEERPWGDPAEYLTPAPPLFAPGTAFKYHDPAIHQLGYILTRLAEEPLEGVFKRRIADPIGMTRWDWKDLGVVDGMVLDSPSGIYRGGIHISARQMARFGLLYLNRGTWSGRHLIAPGWVDQATSTQVSASLPAPSFDAAGRFGFMWWTNGVMRTGKRPWPSAPAKTYTALGGNRNFCFVVPEWNMVIVRMDPSVRMAPSVAKADQIWSTFFGKLRQAILDATLEGDLKAWHPITLSFRGPAADETDDHPNPFLDYRLQTTFTGPSGRRYDAPGFFDGDGCGGGVGNVWRVRFTPDEPGRWRYRASLRRGPRVAVSLDKNAGTPEAFDATEGSFEVAPRDPDAPGFLGKGRLTYQPGSFYLKTLGDRRYWLKGGCDSPENLLAYDGFDNTTADPRHPTWFHRYRRHLPHWQPGDPDWGDGRGRGIIGALNYLASQKVNSIYLLPMNIGGDGQDVWPFVGKIDRKGNPQNDNLHYDIAKLRQWEIVFDHAQRKGIMLHMVLGEMEIPNKTELDSGALGIERRLFYREMIARFGHHNGIQWNLSEEYQPGRGKPADLFSPKKIRRFAGYIKAVDPYDHPLTVHNAWLSSRDPFYGDARFDGTSVQYHPEHRRGRGTSDAPWYGGMVEHIRRYSRRAGRPLPVMMDELSHATPVDDQSHDQTQGGRPSGQTWVRKHVLYAVYFSGGQIEHILSELLATDDLTKYEDLWRYTWYARKFIQEHLPYWQMEPADHLVRGETTIEIDPRDGQVFQLGAQVFAKPGEVYAIHFPKATSTGTIDLSGARGIFEIRWYDPRMGKFRGGATAITGGGPVPLGHPPRQRQEDWIALIQRAAKPSATREQPR